MHVNGHWVHDLNPMIIDFGGGFGLRWYGLAYLLGFLIGYWLLRRLRRRGLSPLTEEQEASAVGVLILGVILGGRLGYLLLYRFGEWTTDPFMVFRVWEGGMSSHGGFLGVAAACAWLTLRWRISFPVWADLLAFCVPAGLFLGRIANFINGELWGTVSRVPWAVVFPNSAPPGTPLEAVPPRHPSQLYEALLEGLVLLAFTQWRVWKTPVLRTPGRLTGEFLLLYSAGRVLAEPVPEPAAALVTGLPRGVFYTLFLVLLGVGFLLWSRRPPAPISGK